MRASTRPAGAYRSVPAADVKAFPEQLRVAGYYSFVTEKLDYQFSGTGTATGPFTIWDAEDAAALWRGRDPGQPFFGLLNFLETHDAGALGREQEIWFEPPGPERLFDTSSDPWELRNLASDPQYAADLARMRSALDAWLACVGDARETPEDELVARFEPRGQPEVTPPPGLVVEGRRVSIRSDTAGASLGYRVDGDRWRLYTGPFDAPPGSKLRAKAVRYGWDESEEVSAKVPGREEAGGSGSGVPGLRGGDLRGRAPPTNGVWQVPIDSR